MANPARSVEHRSTQKSYSLIEELNRAVKTGGERERLRILQRIADLFTAGSCGYSGEHIALFDDILQELAADVETEVRARLANQLAHLDNAPPKFIRALAFDDEITVAEPVLTHSRQLNDTDLIENASSKSQKHLLAIAKRIKLTEAVTDVLVERGNRAVLHTLARNNGARISLAGYGTLTRRAREDRNLTLALGARGDLPRQFFLKLLEGASASVRAKLEQVNPQAALAIRSTVDQVATALQHETRETSSEFAAAALDGKRRTNIAPFTEASVHSRARAQEFERAAVALSRAGGFPIDMVERALLDKGEDMILILAKAAGFSWATAKELLLMYIAERNLQAEDLSHSYERYQALSDKTAKKVVRFYHSSMRLRSKERVS
jgi:uncharacterized protein (DUF2336 family)